MWRARGSENGVVRLIGHFDDELDAARAAQQWLIEQLSKVMNPLQLITHMLDSKSITNFAVATTGKPSEQAPGGAKATTTEEPVLGESSEAEARPHRVHGAPFGTGAE
jgi:hypothetical protein